MLKKGKSHTGSTVFIGYSGLFLLCGNSLYLNTASYFSVFDQQLWLISHFKLTSNIATSRAVPDHLSGLKRDGVDY